MILRSKNYSALPKKWCAVFQNIALYALAGGDLIFWRFHRFEKQLPYSGTNFNRPSFQRMISDIDDDKVNYVIVKDMSRLGRNYLEVGKYTEMYFPANDVRFIAINNGIDSATQQDNDFTPFLNIINEWYLRDLSRKQRATIKVKCESGKRYIFSF